MTSLLECDIIYQSVTSLIKCVVINFLGSTANGRDDLKSLTVDEWLTSLSLDIYVENFRDNFFTSMDRVVDVWDDELTSILEVSTFKDIISDDFFKKADLFYF